MNPTNWTHVLQYFLMIFSGTVVLAGLFVIMMEPMLDE